MSLAHYNIFSFKQKLCFTSTNHKQRFIKKKTLVYNIFIYISVHVRKKASWKGTGWHPPPPSIPDAGQAPSSEEGLRHKLFTCQVNNI